jgi:uncharacterized protein YbaP (TraB family)
MKTIFHRLALSLFLLIPALAQAQDVGKIAAHPALWIVHGKTGTAYLFGSLHLLPANVTWHTPAIDAALAASDVFVFEAPTDAGGIAAVQKYVAEHGVLPAGTTLPGLLPPAARADYEAALDQTQIPHAMVDNKQPWFASILLEVSLMMRQHYSPDSGVDRQVITFANAQGKPLRYFETVDQQMALMDPPDRALALKEFAIDLKSFRSEPVTLGALVDAWAQADSRQIDRLMNSDLAKVPGAKKALLDDRNKAWVAKIDAMLDEPHTYFITVGAAHLVGPQGVPALLRAKGYKIEGP